jgi:protein gp37
MLLLLSYNATIHPKTCGRYGVLTVWRRTGLAVKKTSADGKTTYAFTGKIQLLPDPLADPLPDHIPKMYFVNSMSDLFHKDVPDEFIEAVFEVMERAHWHTFQVLTRRPVWDALRTGNIRVLSPPRR